MILFIAMGVLLAVGIWARFVAPAVKRHRMTAELRRDWWPKFESDLQAYSRAWKSRQAERRS